MEQDYKSLGLIYLQGGKVRLDFSTTLGALRIQVAGGGELHMTPVEAMTWASVLTNSDFGRPGWQSDDAFTLVRMLQLGARVARKAADDAKATVERAFIVVKGECRNGFVLSGVLLGDVDDVNAPTSPLAYEPTRGRK